MNFLRFCGHVTLRQKAFDQTMSDHLKVNKLNFVVNNIAKDHVFIRGEPLSSGLGLKFGTEY